MTDVFPASHWAVRGEPPGYDTPDEDVYLDGRNVVLIAKAAVLMVRTGMTTLYLGPLKGNPFPDATPAFFSQMAAALSTGLAHEIRIVTPLVTLSKSEVIRQGLALEVPLGLTLSCMQPRGGRHCGRCSKCRERQAAFADAALTEPADYC